MPFRRTNFMTRRQMREAMSIRSFHEKFIALIASAQAYAKFWVAVAGGVLIIATQNVPIPEEWVGWATTGIAILTAFSVYQWPNAVPPLSIAEAEQAVRQAHADDIDKANRG